jgi:hypothetical protein
MPDRITIELPLPPKALSPNPRRGGAWQSKARAVKQYRATCAQLLALAVRGALEPPVIWHQDYFASRRDSALGLYHPQDEENAIGATKAARDAMKDARIVQSDARKNVKLGTCRLFSTARECKGPGRVVVTLETEN